MREEQIPFSLPVRYKTMQGICKEFSGEKANSKTLKEYLFLSALILGNLLVSAIFLLFVFVL